MFSSQYVGSGNPVAQPGFSFEANQLTLAEAPN